MPVTGTGCDPPSTPVPFGAAGRANSEVEWDGFDPQSYVRKNYAALRPDDRQLLCGIRDFFAAAGLDEARCVDVGSGANLYPVLSLLPFARSIDLCDLSRSNLAWLRRQITGYDPIWDPYWRVCAELPAYAAVTDPRARLAQAGRALEISVFDLPRRMWDAGTMFFVACSISDDPVEAERATSRFLGALRPGSPFGAAFMLGSGGYRVGQRWFPAGRLERADVAASIAAGGYELAFRELRPVPPLRDEHLTMLLVTGRSRG
ncbi:SCO2525 family SAM-dependent methyltransferase [Plantactinospora siamensis]|uniref:SCO2525 family SAM-dependent methyltransferase n=1 Tax=Plantactinospora siamensis TaxID=555372 RepID=A0ABV6P4P0_9ACTN